MKNVEVNKINSLITPWHINKQLGEGGYGKVYEISREEYGNTYKAALKTITIPQSQAEIISAAGEGMDDASIRSYYRGVVEKITRECAIMSKFKGNSNIVSYEDHKIIEHSDDIGWDILIRMELLTPMLEYEQNHIMMEEDVIKLGIDICSALELCHRNNVIHRDIKPENIFVSEDGNFKLGDFGIARTIEKTMVGLSKTGTAQYMAPEVYKGEEYGFSVDIYSLGILLYRCLNNKRTPFMPTSSKTLTHSDRENARKRVMLGEKMPKPLNGSKELTEIVLKACSYSSFDRYSSPSEMKRALQNLNQSIQGGDKEMSDNTRNFFDTNSENSEKEKPEVINVDNKASKTKNNNKIWLKVGIIACLVAVIVGVGILLIPKLNTGGEAKNAVTYTLMPDNSVLDSQLKEIANAIEERVKVLGSDYKIDVVDQTIELKLGEGVLSENTEKNNYIANLLCSQGNFKVAINMVTGCSEFSNEGFENLEIETEEKGSLYSYYKEQMVDDSSYKVFDQYFDTIDDGTDLSYIHATLTDKASSDFKECIDYIDQSPYGGHLYSVFDLEIKYGVPTDYVCIGRALTNIDRDSSNLYILSPYSDDRKVTDLIYYILTHDALQTSLSLNTQDIIDYESGEQITGKYQKDNLTGKNLLIKYEVDTDSDAASNSEKFAKIVTRLKDRLDVLEEDYALGYSSTNPRIVVVKIAPKALGSQFIRLLAGNGNGAVNSQYNTMLNKVNTVSLVDNKISVICESTSNTLSDMELIGLPDGAKIYLRINDVTIAESTKPAITDGTPIVLNFDNLLFINDDKIDSGNNKVANLVVKCADDEDESSGFKVAEVKYVDTDEKTIDEDIPWGYNCNTEVDDVILNKINSNYSEAHAYISFSSANSLVIKLKIDKSDKLPEQFASLVKKIYTECNLDDGSYKGVTFAIDGDDESNSSNLCRIGFIKTYGYIGDASYTAFKIIGGPAFERYEGKFDEIFKTDEFYSSQQWYN